ncbi:hypothetical protein [Salinimicrobium xinjiangense]|uniref:hypothetical protein n=1 Tax=Salinimicrobium xinjiangense TaxID=438596 RepID=UPI00040CF85A|nr:hypothetical protein [Salinimicrobium xinjiangense]
MVITAIILISLAVILGLYLITFVLKKKTPPKGVALIHGTLAALGIIVLLIYALTTSSHHKHWDSIIIFIVAAIGGIYLFSKDIRHLEIPVWVAVVHGAIGLTGLGWILYHVAGS